MSRPVEHTLAIVKCHAINHEAEIMGRAARAGLVIYQPQYAFCELDSAAAAFLYKEHEGRPYYDDLIRSVTSGGVAVFALSGIGAVKRWRRLLGATNPEDATPGCIRGDFGWLLPDNAAHGSDSVEAAERELNYFIPGYLAKSSKPE